MARARVLNLLRDEKGVSAVEFALVGPVFLALLLGVIQCSLLVFTQASLHYAVQKGVRWAALQTCDHSAVSYAVRHYFGPGATPEFTCASMACGRVMTATVTYSLSVVLYHKDIPLSATSCFPDIQSTSP